MTKVLLHPNHGENVVLVDDFAYHWDGALNKYRPGYGPYGTMTRIGDWQAASPARAQRLLREIPN